LQPSIRELVIFKDPDSLTVIHEPCGSGYGDWIVTNWRVVVPDTIKKTWIETKLFKKVTLVTLTEEDVT